MWISVNCLICCLLSFSFSLTHCLSRANYKNGTLLDKPRPCASNSGTMMIVRWVQTWDRLESFFLFSFQVQGLFENMPQRRKALKSGQEEYGHIQTCVQNYAIHYYQISFILKRVHSFFYFFFSCKNHH